MTKDEIYMNMVDNYSNFSKCQFTKVACFIVNENGRIISPGVNGTIPGDENCCDHVFETREDHVKYTKENEIHAESNSILELATNQTKYSKLSVYVNLSPCHECLKLLLGLTRNSGHNKITIEKIVFKEKYHRTTDQELIDMKAKAAKYGCQLLSLEETKDGIY